MQTSISRRRAHRALLIAALATVAMPSHAVRVGGAPAPSASAVQALVPQAAQAQNDESASLRQGTVTALDPQGTRLQVQGQWLDVVDGKTLATRKGKTVGIDTLKVGDTIRFTVAPGNAEAASLRLIYVP